MLEFSSMMDAVKRRYRTDQYKILAALYCLHGHEVPVTARQISDLLKLKLGKKNVPGNVNASLRTYSAYVEPTEGGRPLKWLLTRKGLDRLRADSELELSSGGNKASFASDVGFVCALEHPELAALKRAIGRTSTWQDLGDAAYSHVYQRAEVATADGRHLSIVSTTATSMGLTAAAIATTQLILQYRPRMIIMVGIAAGTRGGDKQFGDVLVADPSVDYSSGKVVESDGIREFLPDPYPIGLNPRLRSLLQKYRSDHAVFHNIRNRWRGTMPTSPNRLHLGPVGAADQVIEDASRVEEIRSHWRKLIGVEMETYGVYRASHEAPEPKPRFVSFKSVCDFAAEKSDSWQAYAAFMAAEFAIEFLKAEWDHLWPPA